MKGVIVGLLAVIALGVVYLAYSNYRDRQQAREAIAAIADPNGYAAKKLAERAKLKCDHISSVEMRNTVGAGPIPTRFICDTPRAKWLIAERKCTESEEMLFGSQSQKSVIVSTGYPSAAGQLFKPLSVLCWESRAPPSTP